MVGEFVISLSIAFDDFFHPLFKAAENPFFPVIFLKFPIYHKKILFVFYVLGGHGIKVAFSKGKMVNGIQNIGFAYPIVAHKTIYFGIEIEIFGCKVFIINK